jgi:glycosyltransferase involved in cell wall biosynthesis
LKLALITDTDQLGRSGVGDYALLLAGKLQSLGYTAEVFPMVCPFSNQRSELPSRLSAYHPDWVSFQFVPYAFAHRGLVTRRSLPWRNLRGKRGTHFMFHEIWIGSHVGARIRDRATGWLQRRGIRSVVRQVQPDVVHCSNRLYSALLKHAGIPNSILPLFGNVPVLPRGIDPYQAVIASLIPGSDRKDWHVAAFFGTIHSGANVVQVLRWLKDVSERQGRRLLVVSLGRCPDAEEHFRAWSEALGETDSTRFVIKGEMPSGELSAWLGAVDCGVSTTPHNIIEKSGSAVAFAEHGVPVIVADSGAPVRGVSTPRADLTPDLWLFGDERLSWLESLPPRREPQSRLDQVARQFLADLENAGGLRPDS